MGCLCVRYSNAKQRQLKKGRVRFGSQFEHIFYRGELDVVVRIAPAVVAGM